MREKWHAEPIGAVCQIIRGVTYRGDAARSAAAEGLVPLLRATNVHSGKLQFDGLVYVPAASVSPRQLLRCGDVIVVASSGSKAVVGKAAPVGHEWHGTFGAFCLVLRPDGQSVDPRFLSHFLQTPEYRSGISALAAGVNINNLRREHLEEFFLPVPARDEQVSVVLALDSHLSRLDAATATLERSRRNLKRYRASVLKAAVEGRLVPTEATLARAEARQYEPASALLERILAERRARWQASGKKGKYKEPAAPDTRDLPELPEGWCWASLDQISEVIRNGLSIAPRAHTGTRVLRISAVRAMSVDVSDVRFTDASPTVFRNALVRTGALLFIRYNGNPALVGGCGRVPDGFEGPLVHPDKLIRVEVVPNLIESAFVETAANTGASRRSLEFATRTTAGQAGISGTDLKRMPIPIAPLEEQRQVSLEVSRLLTIAAAAEATIDANLARIRILRSAILSAAFRGELVPGSVPE